MSWDKVEKDVEGGPFGLFKWIVIGVCLIAILLGVLGAIGKIGGTAVDRVVMKNSFQYVEGMEQRAAILQANISEIDIRLRSNPENSDDLNNQRMILSSQLKAITINQ